MSRRLYTAAVLLCIVSHSAARPDVGFFGFPEATEESVGQRNPQNKQPIDGTDRCAENELLYPADYHNEYVCDCKPGYLYHPDTSLCYAALRQGPCADQQVLVLTQRSYLPLCMRNPCREGDGYVLLNTGCHKLGTVGPCMLPELGFVVALNVTTLRPECLSDRGEPATLHTRGDFDEDDEDVTTKPPVITTTSTTTPATGEIDNCPIGGRRWTQRKCKSTFN